MIATLGDYPIPMETYSQDHENCTYQFGAFTVLPKERLLLRSGRPVRIGSRALDLLCALCRRAGQVISKEELMRAVWGGRVVEDGNLRVHMTSLRKALNDGHSRSRHIANIPLRGYALVTPVSVIENTGTSMSLAPVPPRAAAALATGSMAVVHIIDDDDALRSALESSFRSVGLATATYSTAAQFLSGTRSDCPSCLLLDVRLPGLSGLDFQKQLTVSGISIPVVLMTGYGDIAMCASAMKAGAVDFLAKPFRDQDMLDAVTQAIEMDRVRRAEQLDAESLQMRYSTLSARERQVMAMVTSGKMNKQIAAALGLSVITVKIHRGHAMRKMSAKSLAALVRMAGVLHIDAD